MSDLDFLDFDITLADDALRFGLKAQGDACVDDNDTILPSLPPVMPPETVLIPTLTSKPVTTPAPAEPKQSVTPREMHDALLIAKETYGETNSEHSEVFCHWVDDVLLGATTVRETREMLELLHNAKEGFSGRLSWLRAAGSVAVDHVAARRNASICAMNIVRAVLNDLRGLSCSQWVERSLYRATLAEGDVKGDV